MFLYPCGLPELYLHSHAGFLHSHEFFLMFHELFLTFEDDQKPANPTTARLSELVDNSYKGFYKGIHKGFYKKGRDSRTV